jgi:hypothetical protein
MKIIFLDVDGVLNTIRTARIFGSHFIDDALVVLVAQIVTATDAKIVLSSSWRIDEDDKKVVEKALAIHGLEIFDCTPVIDPPPDSFVFRSKEIQLWLDDKVVQKFVILDDDPRADLQEGSFFQIDETIGLTMETTERAISHLMYR